MGFADELSDGTAVLRPSFDQLGPVEPFAFDNSAKLKLTGALATRLSFGSQHHSHHSLGGSPVLAWRRQHRRNVRSVLPPLDRCGRQSKDLPHMGNADSQPLLRDPAASPSGRNRRKKLHASASLPPGDVAAALSRPSTPSLKPLRYAVAQQGPSLRPVPFSLQGVKLFDEALPTPKRKEVAAKTQQISAMALDLMSDKENARNDEKHESKTEPDQDCIQIEEELLLPTPEGPVEHLWFQIGDLEDQARQMRKDQPQKPQLARFLRAIESEEFSADGDEDDEFAFVSYMSNRVRPGEFLLYDDKINDISEQDVTDMAVWTAENAVGMGLCEFLAEAFDDEFGDEEEV